MTEAVTYKMPESRTIVCLGDSITTGYWDEEGLGWVARLSQKLARDYPLQYGVYNFGMAGDTTRDGWHNLIGRVPHIDPDILIIALGINDLAVLEGVEPETCQLPYVERQTAWQNILDFVRRMGWQTLVVGPLPVEKDSIRFDEENEAVPGYRSFRWDQDDIRKYNDDLEKLCQTKKISFLRVFEEWEARLSEGLYVDGLHPNAKGHEMMANIISKSIK